MSKQMKRPELISLIEGAGIDLAALCKKQPGEIVAQPSRPFLQSIVDKYGLCCKNAPAKEGGLIKYVSQSGGASRAHTKSKAPIEDDIENVVDSCEEQQHVDSGKAPMEEDINKVEDSCGEQQQEDSNMDENEEELHLNQEGIDTTSKLLESEYQQIPEEQSSEEPEKREKSEWYPNWYPEVAELGYGYARIIAPNKAVQVVLGCIVKKELHKYFLKKEEYLGEDEISGITFSRINNMFHLVNGINSAGDDIIAAMGQIDDLYQQLPTAHAQAESKEIWDVVTFVKCSAALELANKILISNPIIVRKGPSRKKTAEIEPEPVCLANCLFDVNMLPEEQKKGILKTNSTKQAEIQAQAEVDILEDYSIKALTLTNCSSCPVMSARLVELHAVKYNHALWETKNLGVLAPISVATWRKLCNITDEEVEQANKDAISFTRRIGKVEIKMPFKNTKFFGKQCDKDNGIFLGQKGHMAVRKIERDGFYIVKLWRTFCPFFKCRCDKFGDKEDKCGDHITWFDHGVWYMMNNMHKMWPDDTCMIRFYKFYNLMNSKNIRVAAIAFLSYLKVREILIDMTKRMGENKDANFQAEFGDNVLVGVLEMTIKHISFLKQFPPLDASGRSYRERNQKRVQVIEEDDVQIVMPPSSKIKANAGKKAPAVAKDQKSGITMETDTTLSVNKHTGVAKRSEGMERNRISF